MEEWKGEGEGGTRKEGEREREQKVGVDVSCRNKPTVVFYYIILIDITVCNCFSNTVKIFPIQAKKKSTIYLQGNKNPVCLCSIGPVIMLHNVNHCESA